MLAVLRARSESEAGGTAGSTQAYQGWARGDTVFRPLAKTLVRCPVCAGEAPAHGDGVGSEAPQR
eukprot:152415-Rhodomonas_salina.4